MQSHCSGEEFEDNLDRNYSQRKNINSYADTGNTSKGLEEPVCCSCRSDIRSSDFGDDLDDSHSQSVNTISWIRCKRYLKKKNYYQKQYKKFYLKSSLIISFNS